MKNLMLILVGVAVGWVAVALVSPQIQGQYQPKETGSQPEIDRLQNEVALSKKEVKRLEDESRNLKSLIAKLENELQTSKNTPTTSKPDKSKISDEDKLTFKKMAKVLVKTSKKGNDFSNLTPEEQKEIMESMADLLKMMSKYDMNALEMGRGNITISSKSRLFILGIAQALFEEIEAPLNDTQLAQLDGTLSKLEEESKKLQDPSFTKLERIYLFSKMGENIKFDQILNSTQLTKIQELGGMGSILETGFINPNPFHEHTYHAASSINDAADKLLTDWSLNLKLSDSEKEIVRPHAERYITDWIRLEKQVQSKFGPDFHKVYFNVYPSKVSKEEQEKLQEEYNKTRATKEYKQAEYKANMLFLEQQVKHQKDLRVLIGSTKDDEIKKMGPIFYNFSGIQ